MVGRLLDELKQTKPFASREDEAFLNLVRTTDLLRREAAELMKQHDLTHAQYNVLRILRGGDRQAKTCGDISSRLVTHEPDVTRLLDKLVQQGLIERDRDEHDRRVVRSRITTKGLDLLQRLDEPVRAAAKDRLGRLGQTKLTHLIDLLEAIRA